MVPVRAGHQGTDIEARLRHLVYYEPGRARETASQPRSCTRQPLYDRSTRHVPVERRSAASAVPGLPREGSGPGSGPAVAAEGDDCQTCPPSEFDLDSYSGNERDKELEEMAVESYHTFSVVGSNLNSGKVTNLGPSCLGVHESPLSTDISSSLPILKTSAKSPVETQVKTAKTTPRRKVSRLSTLTTNGLESGENRKLNLYIGDMEQEEIAPENCYTRPLESDSPLWVKLEIKGEEYDPRYGSTTPEPEPQRGPLYDVKSEN